MEQRRSHDDERHGESPNNPDVFADEFALEGTAISELDFSIADGFRPSTPAEAPRVSRLSQLSSASLRRSALIGQPSNSKAPFLEPPRRSSIAKNPTSRHSFTLANDGSRAPVSSRGSVAYEESSRPASPTERGGNASMVRQDRSSNAEFSEDSHTATTAAAAAGMPALLSHRTSSTQQPARPAHAYALYQQTIDPATEDDDAEAAPPIQVGFPGRNANFRRQRGPDGEEQDIIGPDGHTEQLPPYTEHADANERAYAARSRAAPPIPAVSQESVADSPTTVAPASTLQRSTSSSPASSPDLSSEEFAKKEFDGNLDREKSWKEKSWKEKRRTKVLCGVIPLWMLLLGLGCAVFIAVVLGGTIGGLASRDNVADAPIVTVTATPTAASMFDASPIPSPSGLGPMPTGIYFLPLGPPEETQRQCITATEQSDAWSCNVMTPPLNLEIQNPPGGYYIAKIYTPRGQNDVQSWVYGPQPPIVMPPQKLMFVNDLVEPQRGPALYFQTFYDKTVVLPGDAFNSHTESKRHEHSFDNSDWPARPRHRRPALRAGMEDPYLPEPKGRYMPPPPPHYPPPPPPFGSENGRDAYPPLPPSPPSPPLGSTLLHRKNAVNPGDEPWFCYWNATFVEGFIYVRQNLTTAANASTSVTASPTLASFTTSSAITTAISQSSTSFIPSSPSAVVTSTSTPTPQVLPRSAYPLPLPERPHDRQAQNPTSTYPFPIKLTERRLTSNPSVNAPYCQKMAIASDGSIKPVIDDDGQPLRIQVAEQDPSDADFKAAATSAHASATKAEASANLQTSASASSATASPQSRIKRAMFLEKKGWRQPTVEEVFGSSSVEKRYNSDDSLRKRGNYPGHSCACRWLSTGF